ASLFSPPVGQVKIEEDSATNLSGQVSQALKIDTEHRISVHELAIHRFLCGGFCLKSLPDTAFDVVT
ncbi:hypothetical protein BGX30_006475, partial [Mortierella sp. GBA39]